MTLEQGFRAIAQACWEQVEANETGVLTVLDPECIHQMRVGLRRLRLALRLFAPVIVTPRALQTDLAWLGQSLGRARDACVLAHDTLPVVVSAFPSQVAWQPLCEHANALASRRCGQARRALASARYSNLKQSLSDWLQHSCWRDKPAKDGGNQFARPLRPHARKRLRRLEKRLNAACKTADSTLTRHQLRIAAKKLRYAIGFFASVCSVKRFGTLKRLTRLQQLLGDLNDANVAGTLLHQTGIDHPELATAAAFARGYLLARSERDLNRLLRP
jgi:triphosphatase